MSMSNFNPLPPCGGRPCSSPQAASASLFQSTPSVWRETLLLGFFLLLFKFQSTPSVWRETPDASGKSGIQPISIHSLRVEGDPAVQYDAPRESISIHSLRVEGDYRRHLHRCHLSDFNPLPPCGGRRKTGAYTTRLTPFQSTPSVWRETFGRTLLRLSNCISIHSLRVEGDRLGMTP